MHVHIRIDLRMLVLELFAEKIFNLKHKTPITFAGSWESNLALFWELSSQKQTKDKQEPFFAGSIYSTVNLLLWDFLQG